VKVSITGSMDRVGGGPRKAFLAPRGGVGGDSDQRLNLFRCHWERRLPIANNR
jgi:hypothetical protein